MAGSTPPDGIEYIAGHGDYTVEVVSGSRHQDRLEWLAQGRGEDPEDYSCTAVLTHEPDNPFDSNAVSVSILGVRVGFLPRDAAADFVAAMQTWEFNQASCDAIVEGGWYRNADDKGDFCIRLDVNPDFAPADALIVDQAPAAGSPMPAAAAPPNAGYDGRSAGLGAAAMFTLLALLGVVWLVIEPDHRDTARRSAVASLESAPEPTALSGARLASASDKVVEAKTATTPTGSAAPSTKPGDTTTVAAAAVGPATETVTPAVDAARSDRAAALPSATARTEPARTTATATAAGGVAADRSAQEMAAAGVGRVHAPEPPTDVIPETQVPVAATPSPAVEEVRAAIDGKRVAAVLTTPVAKEVPPPVTAAFSPPAPPSPQARPEQSESAGDAPQSPPAVDAQKPDGVQAATLDSDEAQAAKSEKSQKPEQAQTARSERKVRTSKRQSRFSRRARASRSYRSRQTRRYRRSRQAEQPRSDQVSAPARPTRSGGALQESQAARMLRGWTREWTEAAPRLGSSRTAQ